MKKFFISLFVLFVCCSPAQNGPGGGKLSEGAASVRLYEVRLRNAKIEADLSTLEAAYYKELFEAVSKLYEEGGCSERAWRQAKYDHEVSQLRSKKPLVEEAQAELDLAKARQKRNDP